MNHLNEELLLKYALQMLEADAAGEVKAHLEACPQCAKILSGLQNDLSEFSNIKADIESWNIPIPRCRSKGAVLAIWKLAAVFILGLLTGYALSNWTQPVKPLVTAQKLKPHPAALPGEMVFCETVDVCNLQR